MGGLGGLTDLTRAYARRCIGYVPDAPSDNTVTASQIV
jgi:hypothetical protein